jgi:CRISPR-associated protein Csh2
MATVKKSELVFLYDLAWANPNGDPNDSNKPRIDTETGLNYVTDVRLKRTIRDELIARGYTILVQDTYTENGDLADAKHRGTDFYSETMKTKYKKKDKKMEKEDLEYLKNEIKKCIDIRLFGCVLPSDLKNASITYTGPVQFKMGYSLHPVKLEFVKGTGAFSSGEGKDQKTFRQEYVLPYSLINFYGIINDRAAKETGLNEEDVQVLMSAMWNGTKNLISRSKVGQMPRLLLRVSYVKEDFYIGGIDKLVTFEYDDSGYGVRNVAEGTIKLTELLEVLKANKDNIAEVEFKVDTSVKTDLNLSEELEKIGIKATEIPQ